MRTAAKGAPIVLWREGLTACVLCVSPRKGGYQAGVSILNNCRYKGEGMGAPAETAAWNGKITAGVPPLPLPETFDDGGHELKTLSIVCI